MRKTRSKAASWCGSQGVMGLSALVAAVILLSGCGSATRERVIFDFMPAYESVRLDVSNFRGDVRVDVDPSYERAQVRIVERAKNKGHEVNLESLGYSETAHTLEDVRVTSSIEDDMERPGSGVFRVVSETSFAEPSIQRVVLRIRLPRVDGVRVRNREGTVDLANVAGEVWVENLRGKVLLRTAEPIEDAVTITTTEGKVHFRVTSRSVGEIDAEALDSRVILRAGEGRVNVSQHGASRLSALLNEGGNRITLRTTDEPIKIVIDDEDPVTVGLGPKW